MQLFLLNQMNPYLIQHQLILKFNPIKELQLPHTNTSILLLLRAEHGPLNGTQHKLIHYEYYNIINTINNGHIQYFKCKKECCTRNNSGRCKYCINKIEDVNHFLMNCKQYNWQRNYLLYEITPIFYQNNIKINLQNILFSPKSLSWHHRKLILSSMQFCN
eukprot:369432_1